MHMIEKILNNTTPYRKNRASHEGSLHSSTLIKYSIALVTYLPTRCHCMLHHKDTINKITLGLQLFLLLKMEMLLYYIQAGKVFFFISL